MAVFKIFPDVAAIAQAAAEQAVSELGRAIEKHGAAVWVLSGGTAPIMAYTLLAENYRDALDWAQVWILMGDERCVPHDNPDSSWGQISQILLPSLPIPEAQQLIPNGEASAEQAAEEYEVKVVQLPKTAAGLPRLDHVWLGMGEDGHTLSLFPNHPAAQLPQNQGRLVIPVHDSPKPPPDRISLTLDALEGVGSALILAAGAAKAPVIAQVRSSDATNLPSLPIAQAAQTIEAAGGHVSWLLDRAAVGE